MTDATPFRAYGENAATFLIFQALAMKPRAIAEIFLPNLKSFGKTRTFRGDGFEDPDVWLFPNFGKGSGFGEPDVLILAGKYAFWIEVETTIDCKKRMRALQKALLQMWRFRLFQDALSRNPQARDGSRRIVGWTLSDDLVERPAELRLRGHGVLKAIRNRLKNASVDGSHHYVLFTVNKPKGEGGGRLRYRNALDKQLKGLSDRYLGDLPRLEANSCWYSYWNKDLKYKFNEAEGIKLDLKDNYVRIKKS